jgi:hypothetical protein
LGEEEKNRTGKLDRSRLVVINKFKEQRALAREANAPVPDVTRIQSEMQFAELEALKAGTPRPRFPFRAQDVPQSTRDGEPGRWFRLRDDRVFTAAASPRAAAQFISTLWRQSRRRQPTRTGEKRS